MKRLLNVLTLLFQFGATFILTFCLCMVFAMFDYKGGMANFIGLTFFQPITAALFSIFTIIICSIIGLPIRLNVRLKTWWSKHFYISIILATIGVISCAISLTPMFIEEITYSLEGIERTDTVPNQILSILGWFVLAFGTLHLYLPVFIEQIAIKLFERILNKK